MSAFLDWWCLATNPHYDSRASDTARAAFVAGMRHAGRVLVEAEMDHARAYADEINRAADAEESESSITGEGTP